jgi:hypothetical protein
MSRPIPGQTQIDVPPAPGAIGRWSSDHELAAYAEQFGSAAAERQRKLAVAAGECSCGEQKKADRLAELSKQSARRIGGHMHKPGCPAFRPIPKAQTRISGEEQERRLNEGRS